MRSSVIRAVLFGCFLAIMDEILAVIIHDRGLKYFDEVIIANLFSGVLGGTLLFVYLEDRKRRTKQRMEELAFLNHHIRNALMAIKFSSYAESDSMRLEIVSDASRRIESTLRQMSEQEHVSLEPLVDIAQVTKQKAAR
jgi:hypothetical protein